MRRTKQKEAKAPEPGERITAVVVQIEITPFDSAGKTMQRPIPMKVAAFESEMPKPVVDWLWGKVKAERERIAKTQQAPQQQPPR